MSATPRAAWRDRVYRVIFESDTPSGKAFDLALIALIAVSAVIVMALSVKEIRAQAGDVLLLMELVITVLFAIEYVLRVASAPNATRYALSPFGIIDLVATAAPILAFVLPDLEGLAVVRLARVLRILRVVRVAVWVREADVLVAAVVASMRKIALFMGFVLVIVTVLGSILYVIEGPEHGFTSIPLSVYWAIVTVTTVGFGDVVPQTALGKGVASVAMLLGYAIIAVPTGIVASELGRSRRPHRACVRCGADGHLPDAHYCRRCAERLPEPPAPAPAP